MDVLDNINDNDSLYIFCDASTCVATTDNGFESNACAGVVAVNNGTILRENYRIIKNANAAKGEIEAIKDGVFIAILLTRKYPNLKNIYLFSDSEISILGIRDRIFNWECHRINGKDYYGLYRKESRYTTGSGLIKNQDIYLEILYTLIENNLNLKFYHQKGHLNVNIRDNLKYAIELFKRNNNIRRDISKKFMTFISAYNDYVDSNSRSELYEFMNRNKLFNLTEPVRFVISNINDYRQDISLYKLNYGGRYNGKT